jgi:CRISPR-associated endonuclease/helicase Cas3
VSTQEPLELSFDERRPHDVVTSLEIEDFRSFFESVWAYPPFAWQTRLLARVRSKGWPPALDLPTGSGKTAALDVALFALALDAFEQPPLRRQPRRIVLVVDRRTVVDQAYDRAVRLAGALREARDGVLLRVANALRSLQGDSEALPVLPGILRGGMPRESEWARTPHQPVLLVSTVDQVGSRLLFRGYGVSDRMKPVHAGLLGCDTLVLLDEVHLSRPFEETLEAVSCYAQPGRAALDLPRTLSFVRMSGTLSERAADVFGLETAERSEPVLARRLSARKQAALREVTTPGDPARAREAVAKACFEEVARLASRGPRAVAVIVNRVDTARRAALLARETLPSEWDVKLLTGRMRPLDRMDLEAGLIDRVRAGRSRCDDRLLVVATQAVEAGADFDFDALVTECASLDALRQRFGRLDRLGDLSVTEAVVVAGSRDVAEGSAPDPVYGAALRATWQWLQEGAATRAEDGERVIDFGILSMDALFGELDPAERARLLPPRAMAPILTSSHLDRWVQTSPVPSADPEVVSFLHGIGRGTPEVNVVWRADLETHMMTAAHEATLRSMLAVVPPSALEALPLPIWAARHWLALVGTRDARIEPEATDAAGLADVEGVAWEQEDTSAAIAPSIAWRGDDTVVVDSADEIRPGDTLVVPACYGGLDGHFQCWDPEADDEVRDRGDEAQLLHRGRAVVRWSRPALRGWKLGDSLMSGPTLDAEDFEERGTAAELDAFEAWGRAVRDDPGTPEWARLALETFRGSPAVLRVGSDPDTWRASVARRRVALEDLRRVLGVAMLRPSVRASEPSTEGDEGSFIEAEVTLERHLAGVRSFAERFARAVSLPEGVASDVALAGWLHDLGKADPRFQLWLHGGDPVSQEMALAPLAKSPIPMRDRAARERARRRAGYPRGARHELTSVALVQHCKQLRGRAHDWDLVLHLVASHHGWCRPFAPPVLDPEPVDVKATIDGIPLAVSSEHRLARIDSGVAERFWKLVRRYGWWGMAWLEAILRLADHRESEREEGGG